MQFYLTLADIAKKQLLELKANPANIKRYNAVLKTLKFLEQNPRHPSLNTHEYTSLSHRYGQKIYEAYAENNTPGAYRIFWRYGNNKGEIEIMMITAHP